MATQEEQQKVRDVAKALLQLAQKHGINLSGNVQVYQQGTHLYLGVVFLDDGKAKADPYTGD